VSLLDSEPVRKRVQKDSIFLRGGNVIRQIQRTRTNQATSKPEDPQNKRTSTNSRHSVSQRNIIKGMKTDTNYPQDFDFKIQTNEMKMPDLKFKKNVGFKSPESHPNQRVSELMQAPPLDSTSEPGEANSFDPEPVPICQSGKPLIRIGFDPNYNSKPRTSVDHSPPNAKEVEPVPRKSNFTE
jgi:hypothetical protein